MADKFSEAAKFFSDIPFSDIPVVTEVEFWIKHAVCIGCEKLEEIQLPEEIEYVGSCAFFLTSITSLSIPESCEVEDLTLLNKPNEIVRQ